MYQINEKTEEVYQLFNPVEGKNTCIYGKLGNGKSSTAVAMMLDLLERGETVVSTIELKFDGFDERNSIGIAWAKFLGGRSYFFKYGKGNFYYLNPDDLFNQNRLKTVQWLSSLIGVHIFIDEGQWFYNSMEKYNPNDEEHVAKLKLILHGRHYCRSFNVITQRPANISTNIRSQVNVWYRCTKRFDGFGWILIQRWAIEDMKDNLPVEFISKVDKNGRTIRDIPNGDVQNFWFNKKTSRTFAAYNTHQMRRTDAFQMDRDVEVFESNRLDRFLLVLKLAFPRLAAIYGRIRGKYTDILKGRALSKSVKVENNKSPYISLLKNVKEVKKE